MAFKRCSISTKVCHWYQSVPRKYPPHHYTTTSLNRWVKDPCFHVLYVKFWPYHLNVAAEIKTHQTRQRFSNLLLSNFGEPVRIVASVSDRSSTRCGLLLQGSMCCAFRDGILHTLVVTSGYLSYCCLSIISNQSAHSPLTSTRHFHPHNCRSLDIFSFSDHCL